MQDERSDDVGGREAEMRGRAPVIITQTALAAKGGKTNGKENQVLLNRQTSRADARFLTVSKMGSGLDKEPRRRLFLT